MESSQIRFDPYSLGLVDKKLEMATYTELSSLQTEILRKHNTLNKTTRLENSPCNPTYIFSCQNPCHENLLQQQQMQCDGEKQSTTNSWSFCYNSWKAKKLLLETQGNNMSLRMA